jgi:hypothetical protein
MLASFQRGFKHFKRLNKYLHHDHTQKPQRILELPHIFSEVRFLTSKELEELNPFMLRIAKDVKLKLIFDTFLEPSPKGFLR